MLVVVDWAVLSLLWLLDLKIILADFTKLTDLLDYALLGYDGPILCALSSTWPIYCITLSFASRCENSPQSYFLLPQEVIPLELGNLEKATPVCHYILHVGLFLCSLIFSNNV